MENFKQVKKAVEHLEYVDEYIRRVKSMGYIGTHGSMVGVGITDHNNERYTFRGLAHLLDTEKLTGIVKQFELLISAELHAVREKAQADVDSFEIIKKPTL